MSLLIKALEKAEEGKRSDIDELSLEPRSMDDIFIDDAPRKSSPQQTAANVFSAKNVQKNQTQQQRAIAMALLVLIVLGGVGFKFYSYLQSITQPQLVMDRAAPNPPSSPTAPPPAVASTQQPAEQTEAASAKADGTPPESETVASATVDAENEKLVVNNTEKVSAKPMEKATKKNMVVVSTPSALIETTPTAAGSLSKLKNEKVPSSTSTNMAFGDPVPVNDDSKFKVTKNQITSGVNPSLINGYQAFNNGDYAAAQRSYREVLRSDVRNVDALLGMAAIAAAQGRTNDAMAWYGKVLEVDPRNNVAQAAMVNVTAQADPVSSESKLKSMIAQQPESANLYASLGDLYAEQNKWPDAQQAYFQAHHFDPQNPQYAFNLAASLDQMGKPNLALPYYEKALALLPASSKLLDRAQLEARISRLK